MHILASFKSFIYYTINERGIIIDYGSSEKSRPFPVT